MKMICFSARPIKITIWVIITLVLFISMILITETQTVFFGKAVRKVPIYGVETDSKKIAITFDAAYGADKTQAILNILKEKNIKATFFLVGFWVEKFPDMVKAIHDAGMEIGTHSNTHPQMSQLSESQVRNELNTSIDIIKKVVDVDIKLFRPPFGDYNDRLVSVCDSMGLKPIQWTVDSLDWKGLQASQILARITASTTSGSIILCHNNSDHIVDALPTIIDVLTQKGYTFTTVGDLIYHDNYTIDNNGIQKLNG